MTERPGQAVPLITRHRRFWAVVLRVQGFDWSHHWHGFAANSTDAANEARRDFFGGLLDDSQTIARYPLTVVSCVEETPP